MTAPHPVRGALLCVAALLLFACMDATTKYLTASHEVPLIVAVRYLGNLLMMIVAFAPHHKMEMVRTQRTGLVLVRALCLAMASLLIGLALQRMPVAETTAITFLAPILLVAIAGPLLGERVGWIGWLATLGGFAGVILIVRPGSGLPLTGVVLVLCAVVCNLGYQALSRILATTEKTAALLFYTALVGSILFSLGLPWYLEDAAPSWFEVVLFASLGVYGGLGHFMFTAAFRYAPASLIAPLNYLQLIWAGLLGWIVFGDVPDGVTILGMVIVALSGAMIALKTRRPPEKRTA
ncbi:DMT family transporter [Altererythrobacter sp. Root672]|uniref:DMT family transporter n=1 Tax=Altererythrobacter sp. Root672 TaxID=1736584 RepID=UPI0006F4B785|nr:DMT family transporter [Altererythrobacter sp. Root672]KRA84657.1 permease [Altererythrobacter sp. Root672]